MADVIDPAHKSTHNRGQIDVIEMNTNKESEYKHFFVYEDQQSRFVVLRALRNGTVKEVAVKLLDILTIIGPPQILQSSNGRKFAEQLVRELRVLWKDAMILHGEIFKREGNVRDFKSLLECWIEENPTNKWHEGLKFIQVHENSTFRCQDGRFPCDILFGHNVYKELQNNNVFPKNAFDTMWTEEEWLYLKANRKKIGKIDYSENGRKDSLPEYIIDTYQDRIDDHETVSRRDLRESSENSDMNAFDFVNVKSDIPLNATQIEDTAFEDESKYNIITSDTVDDDLKCKICQKRYMKLGHLKNHMQTHTEEQKIQQKFHCKSCNKSYRISSLYEKHMRRYHNNNRGRRLRREKRNKDTNLDRSNILNIEKNENEESPDKSTKSHCNLRLIGESGGSSNTATQSVQMKDALKSSRITKLNGNGTLECKYCNQKFNFPSVLKRHIRSHTNERPYICEICSKSFKQLGHLSQHSLTHKDYRSFLCSTCGVKFASLDSLKIHSRSHKDETSVKSRDNYRLFECDNCKKVFTTKSVLERHIFTHTHERQFGCKVCGKRFKQAGHVKSHMLVHTGERKFQCDICSKRFSLSNSLKKHMYVHNGEKPYQCDICGARFLEKRNLNGHLMTHTNERPFSCKICGKRYTLADTLRRHISAAHEDGRTYQCEICAKMFKQLAHLSVHKKVHNDERPFQCHLCEKNFKHKNVLKSHLAIHANVRPFECDVCKATFVRKTNLQTHIASAHMNERPYTCTICGKRFKQISHLNGHVVVHSNSMPYQCDFCDRRCNRLDNLKKHMRLHTKNKEQNVT